MKRLQALRAPRILLVALLALLAGGCSVRRFAVDKVGDALASGGTTFASDDDPELVRQAVPFSLKLMESLLAESPRHAGLLVAAASGFTQYGYAFVQQDADELEARDYAGAEAMRDRARRLYLRARGYGLRALEVAHPGFTNRLAASPADAALSLKKGDLGAVYWTATAWAAAIALSKDDPARVAEIPQMEALLDRADALDPDWGDGALQSLMITYEMSRPTGSGDPVTRARGRFERAVTLGRGRLAGPFVGFAESVAVQEQDFETFEKLVGQALAVDPDAAPEFRLLNLVMQRRARWLMSRKDELFLVPVPVTAPAPVVR
jgi:predicted anti-sigma-YlaC factor YlaD